jgi:hypothetical protein
MDEFASRHYPVQEDMRFQRRSWAAERTGWILLALIAVAGLTGVFGTGPLSRQQVSAGPLTVHYEQFQRRTRLAPFRFDVTRTPGAEVSLKLDDAFARDFQIASIEPPPIRSATAPDGIALTFAAEPGKAGSIVIWAHSHRYGLTTVTAAVDGSAPASFWIFIYP